MNARPLRLSTAQADFETLFQQRLHWSADTDAAIEQRVADILADVKARGDAAVLEYTERFDGLKATNMAALELTQHCLNVRTLGIRAIRRVSELARTVEALGLPFRDAGGAADELVGLKMHGVA